MYDDEEGKHIEWEGMPKSMEQSIEQDYKMVKKYPLMCINMVLAEQLESIEGLRPHDEIANVVQEAIEVKTINPRTDYEQIGKLGKGG